MTRRPPTHPPDTLPVVSGVPVDDEPTPRDVPRLAVGSGDRRPVTGRVERYDAEVVLDPFIDAPPDDPRAPRNVDLEGRVAALEKGLRRKSILRTWAERALSALAGSAVVALAWVMTRAEATGDARGAAREQAAERAWLVETVRALDRRDALQQGQIDALIDRLRYPMQGPPMAPRTGP